MANGERPEKQTLPPYVPYRTFTNFLEGLKVGMPSHIDKSVMGSLSGGMQSWLISALRTTKLIDEAGVPSDRLKKLAEAEGEQRQKLLKALFDDTYKFLRDAGIDLATTTPQKVYDAFGELGARGETVEKCVAFMRALAKDAEVPLSRYLTQAAPRRPRGMAKPKPRQQPVDPDAGGGGDDDEDVRVEQTPEQVLLGILDPETMSDEEKSAVWTLLLYLKKRG